MGINSAFRIGLRRDKQVPHSALIRTSVQCCLLFAASALSEEHPFITKFKWKGTEPGVIIAFAVVFAMLIAVLISIYANSRRKNVKTEREFSAKLFDEGCKRCRFTVEEAMVARELAAYAPNAPLRAHLIFETPLLFERCENAYVNSRLRSPQAADLDEILMCVRKKLGYDVLATEQALMSTRNLSVGQKVTFFPVGQSSAARSAIVVHVGEFYFTLRPAAEEPAGRFGGKSGSELTVAFLRHGDAAYSISAKVKEVLSSGEFNFYHTLEFLRNQNRRYMRLDIGLPIKYKMAQPADPNVRPSSEMFQARCLDVGGGGLSFISDKPLSAGDEVLLTLLMPGRTMGGIRSKILNVIPVEGKVLAQYKHLVQFIDIEPPQREQIIKFIFEKQREMLQMR